ncbi:YjcZ family sporulation protein [Chengkuizengella sp. SCS-71B]|uniref:YjcZ family sporulation protein n=1 Tax=Chengkuizengella sp. SCS-71B TaxID=3115290 RepID=UPI0032C2379E
MSGHVGSGAALILVLFILLVIILLASWCMGGAGRPHSYGSCVGKFGFARSPDIVQGVTPFIG